MILTEGTVRSDISLVSAEIIHILNAFVINKTVGSLLM